MTTPGVRETDLFDLPAPLERQAQLFKPTETQLTLLMRMLDAMEHGEGNAGNAYVRFADMVASLFVEQDDWDVFERACMRAQVSDEGFGDLVKEVIERFYPKPEEEAPRTGPRPTKRATKAVRRR